MKKVLLLGGSAQQVIAIETAKRLGFYTVLCDYLDDNPGQFAADKFYLVSTTDKEAVLKVAESEKIDGVIAYASDPAAPTAAFIAEKMGLPTNPYKSVETLCNKDKFRAFLKSGGFNTPKAEGYTSVQSAMDDLDEFSFPIIIKPVDIKEAVELFNNEVISGGMIPKVECCIDAINRGVDKVTIMDGRVPHAILLDMLTDEGVGTMVVKEKY